MIFSFFFSFYRAIYATTTTSDYSVICTCSTEDLASLTVEFFRRTYCIPCSGPIIATCLTTRTYSQLMMIGKSIMASVRLLSVSLGAMRCDVGACGLLVLLYSP